MKLAINSRYINLAIGPRHQPFLFDLFEHKYASIVNGQLHIHLSANRLLQTGLPYPDQLVRRLTIPF